MVLNGKSACGSSSSGTDDFSPVILAVNPAMIFPHESGTSGGRVDVERCRCRTPWPTLLVLLSLAVNEVPGHAETVQRGQSALFATVESGVLAQLCADSSTAVVDDRLDHGAA